ncbi:MAG: hypothetical protein JJV98_18215 [Desulfosarcina sp.]|nr:hypothetical protein [Desulfobacterales bacterium]
MSTILNALKRLEDESRAKDAKQVPVSMAGPAVASGSNSRLRRMIALAGLTMLVVAAVIFWVYGDWPGHVLTRNASQPEPPAVAAIPANSRLAPSATPIPGGRLKEKSRTAQDNLDRIPSKSTRGAPVNAKTILTSPDYLPPNPEGGNPQASFPEPLPSKQAVETSHSSQNPASPETVTPSELKPDETSPKSPAAPPPPHQDPYALAEVLSRDTLRLQAISWSDLPNTRITIIAGQILREGQNVDGYTVILIRPEDVIVEKAGKHWKVVYGGH